MAGANSEFTGVPMWGLENILILQIDPIAANLVVYSAPHSGVVAGDGYTSTFPRITARHVGS